jgi:hypothetical protein
MNILKFSIFTSIFLFVSGCASYYKLPDNIASALIHFQTNLSPVMVQSFADKECHRGPHGVRLAYIDPLFSSKGKYAGPTYIEANKLLVLTMSRQVLGDSYLCSSTVSFTPLANEEYVAHFWTGNKMCNLDIKRKVGDARETVPDLKRNQKICYTPNA